MNVVKPANETGESAEQKPRACSKTALQRKKKRKRKFGKWSFSIPQIPFSICKNSTDAIPNQLRYKIDKPFKGDPDLNVDVKRGNEKRNWERPACERSFGGGGGRSRKVYKSYE